MIPSGTPYWLADPSVRIPADYHSEEPATQSLMQSIDAEPAEAADEAPLKSIISAPLFWTLGVNSLIFQFSSIKSLAAFPLIVQFLTSGYMVGEWLPQIHIYLTSLTELPVLRAS